eukprot:GHUV01037261.1.p1 GENE.GHUV01037261.1~~GHUV01037261.1.p1  ORF type:complete len:284 (+),score=83.78 GHUV01037261.1:631-1482(+)
MPYSLTEYLEAPTPFLMGLHSSEYVDPKLLDSLVVVDLDKDTVSLGKDDGLMRRCLDHPYMKQLTHRIKTLLRPATTDVDALSAAQDPWVKTIRQLSQQPVSPLHKQAVLLHLFIEFFNHVLDGYQLYLHEQPATDPSTRAGSLSTERGLSRGFSSIQEQLRRVSSSAAQLAAAAAGSSTGTAAFAVGRLRRSSSTAASQQSSAVDMEALLQHHQAICRHTDPALLQQIMQGLPFLSFLDQQAASRTDPMGWLSAAKDAMRAWRVAEEFLLADDAQHCSDAGE